MAAKKTKWSPLRAVTLAGLTLAAVVIACDANAPTALDDALLDVLASPEAEAGADGSLTPRAVAQRLEVERQLEAERFRLGNLGTINPRPLIFVDGVEMTNSDLSLRAGRYTVTTGRDAPYTPLGSLNPDDIERIEIIKGAAAAELHGERAEAGVIQIYTIESDTSEPEEPSANDAPSSGRSSEGKVSATSTSRTRQIKPIDVAFYVQLGSPAFVLSTEELTLVP